MKRSVLDQLVRQHRMSQPAIAAALELSGCRPDETAWRAFGARLMNAAGIASIAAGVIFFVAANWQHLGVLGRFIPLQAALVVCVALAWWRPPPHGLGAAALTLAILLAGALLALFGQTYQTGADVFELFFAWSALALPFALASGSGAAWATWWIVLDIGLALYCGWLGPSHFLWSWLDRGGIGKPMILLVPCVVNLGGAALFAWLGRTRFAPHAPRWLVRLLAAIGFLFGTVAAIVGIAHDQIGLARARDGAGQDMVAVAIFAVISALVATWALRTRKDVFPMALVIGSWIAISTAALIVNLKFKDIGGIFLIAVWLIATSTAAGFVLMRWVRTWTFDDDEAREAGA